jgi:tryptophan-rich sensory protein
MKNIKAFIISVLIPLAVGGLSALLSRDGMMSFDIVQKPPLTPPAILFPIAWTILYVLMGIASYFVFTSDSPLKESALRVYGIQLVFNFFWSIIFFNMQRYTFAFVWLLILWLLIILTTVLFYRIKKTAGYLFIPYLVWVTFAAYLNLGIAILN